MFDNIHIFVPDYHQIVRISEGTGDNLLEEDVADGFVDYIYYEKYDLGYDISEVDGGQIMLTELFQDKYKCTEDCIPEVLEMAYGEENLKYTVLK
jgi:hypothetical protein